MYKKGRYIAARLIGLLAVAVLTVAVGIQTPFVQSWLAGKVLDGLKDKMDGLIEYDDLRIMSNGVLMISNARIIDSNPVLEGADTVIRAGKITATFTLKGLIKKEGIHLGRVTVDDGYMHLVEEKTIYHQNLNRVFGKPHKTPADTIPAPGPSIFDINKVLVSNFRFRLSNPEKIRTTYKPGIDFADMDVVADIKAHSVKMEGGKMSGVADKVSVREKSGYVINNLTGRCVAGQGKVIVSDLIIDDPWSDIRFDHFTMSFNGPSAFLDYTNRVWMEAEFERSSIAFESIVYFSGALVGNQSVLDIKKGLVEGIVNNMSVKNLVFTDKYSGVSGTIDNTRLLGVEDVNTFILDAEIPSLTANTRQLSDFLSGFSQGKPVNLSGIAPGEAFDFNLHANGPINSFKAWGRITSRIGSATLNGRLSNVIDTRIPISIKADLRTDALDLGKVTGKDILGECDMETRAGVVLRSGMPDVTIDTLGISRLNAFGLEYRDISVKGSLDKGTLEAMLNCPDSDLDLDLSILADLKKDIPLKRMWADGTIRSMDISPFKLFKGSDRSAISLKIDADFEQMGGIIDGTGLLESLRVTNDGKVHEFGDISLMAFPNGSEQGMSLEAGFLDASYSGSSNIGRIAKDLQNITTMRELPSLYSKSFTAGDTGKYALDIHFHDTRDLLSLVAPGAYVADSTMISLAMDDSGSLNGSVTSNRIAFSSNYLKDVEMFFDNADESLNADINGSELKAGPVTLTAPGVNIFADDDHFSIDIMYDNSDLGESEGEGIFQIDGRMYRDSTGVFGIYAHPLDSYLVIGGKTWNISESGISFLGGDLEIDNFRISNENQSITVDGGIAKNRPDSLTVSISDLSLSILNDFVQGYAIDGRMDGSAKLSTDSGTVSNIAMNMGIDSLSLGSHLAGNFSLISEWDESLNGIAMNLTDELGGRDVLKMTGHYTPSINEAEMVAWLDGLPLDIASVFTSNIFNDLSGELSGRISAIGPLRSLSTGSRDLRLNDARLTLAPTGVSYMVDGPLRLENNGLFFDGLEIRDNAEGSGTASGAVRFDHLQDFALDTRINFNNLKAVDAIEKDNSGFYGNLAISGSASVTGPFKMITVDADVMTSGNGNIHIPVTGRMTSVQSDLLTFTQPVKAVDPYEEMLETYTVKSAARSDMVIHAKLALDQGTRGYVEIDKSTGNMASFNGDGEVNLTMRPSKDIFNINGEYRINEGKYNFVLQGVVAKDFNIQNGSTIQFNGSLPETSLNIDALYNVRTSLTPILPEQNDVSTRRNVECGINISGNLSRPEIGFSVNVPDLDPTTRSEVDAALNTADKMQKQFVALLLMNSFIPAETSGVFNGTNVLFSSVSQLMSNQLNSIFQKLEIPVDVGFGYQNSVTGTDIFDVAISTQLFNNRVIVGGSVGNRKYRTSTSSDFVGDLDIQIKLDPKGKFRLNLFSHSADEFTNYIDNSQRNGVGISYQREYNKFSDIFKSKKKISEAENKRAADPKKDVIIAIDNEQR